MKDKLGMVMTRWKDSTILQIVINVMELGIGEVSRRENVSILGVKFLNNVIIYQKGMSGVKSGDQD